MWTALVKTNSGRLVAYNIPLAEKSKAETRVKQALDQKDFAECLTIVHHLEFDLLKLQPPEILDGA